MITAYFTAICLAYCGIVTILHIKAKNDDLETSFWRTLDENRISSRLDEE